MQLKRKQVDAPSAAKAMSIKDAIDSACRLTAGDVIAKMHAIGTLSDDDVLHIAGPEFERA